MKRLCLVRHAKSSWGDPELRDFDRPLNKRGVRDAPLMADRVAQFCPSASIISSPAQRAKTTAEYVATSLGISVSDIQFDKSLYHADPEDVLEVLREQNNAVETIVVVGHNPGLTELVNGLADPSIYNVPTSGVVLLEFNTDQWESINDTNCQMLEFDYPKKTDYFFVFTSKKAL